jgi:multidrug efflux pump subunit AcrA (membrane-fusion protein)
MRPGALELLADIDELDLPNVGPGAEARFRLDAYPATEITGVVMTTSPVAREQGGATVFTATISYGASEDLDLRPGMNASVTIVTAERDNVLLIPERALTTVGERSFVSVVADGEVTEREVVLGYRANGQVEVVEGLDEGERVVLH